MNDFRTLDDLVANLRSRDQEGVVRSWTTERKFNTGSDTMTIEVDIVNLRAGSAPAPAPAREEGITIGELFSGWEGPS